MKTKRFVLLIGLLLVLAVATMAVAQPGVSAAKEGGTQLQVLIELPPPSSDGTSMSAEELVELVTIACCFQVDSFFDVSYAANIGSIGLDGNTTTFQVDSFFDVFYEISFDNPPSGGESRTVQTEILSMDLSGALHDPTNPAGAIDAVTQAVKKAGGRVYTGHVTLIK